MEELVRGYVEGQVSRRTFIRRAVAAGLTVSGAIVYADLLAATPAYAATRHVDVDDYLFYTPTTAAKLGEYVEWDWSPSSSAHRVMYTVEGIDLGTLQPFNAGPFPAGYFDTFDHRGLFSVAGTWNYTCPDPLHGSGLPMNGSIEIPPRVGPRRGSVGDRFLIEWAISPPTFGVFDVDVKEPGGNWKRWRNAVDRTVTEGRYKATEKGRHRVRARFRNPAQPASAGWSPDAIFTAR